MNVCPTYERLRAVFPESAPDSTPFTHYLGVYSLDGAGPPDIVADEGISGNRGESRNGFNVAGGGVYLCLAVHNPQEVR